MKSLEQNTAFSDGLKFLTSDSGRSKEHLSLCVCQLTLQRPDYSLSLCQPAYTGKIPCTVYPIPYQWLSIQFGPFQNKLSIFQTKQAIQELEVISWSCLRQCSSLKVTVILVGPSSGEVLSSMWGPGHAVVVCWCGHCLREFVLGRGRGHQESQW